MKISVILAHPDPGSFNHAIARTVAEHLEKNHHPVFFHDLYAEKFDPLLTGREIPSEAVLAQAIKVHCDEHSSATQTMA